jgi:hypothetical protein
LWERLSKSIEIESAPEDGAVAAWLQETASDRELRFIIEVNAMLNFNLLSCTLGYYDDTNHFAG